MTYIVSSGALNSTHSRLDRIKPNLTKTDQYACSPGRRAHCYTELATSSPAVAKTIARTVWAVLIARIDGGTASLSGPKWRGLRRSPIRVLNTLNAA